jgi:ankyrin repeat protein
MSEPAPRSESEPLSLPASPDLRWLRKQAKRHLSELRTHTPAAKLADAQLDLARGYGFPSWRALKSHIDSLGIAGRLFATARAGDIDALSALLDDHPDALTIRNQPYEWTLLHAAAAAGRTRAVELLLTRGLDPNAREKGDNAYPMHWAAGGGHLEIVRKLADAGGDVVGSGDDHALEVIGWATCFDVCHRRVANFLIGRGARHHIFSAIAMNLVDEVRRIVASDPGALSRRMSRNENHQLPLHFAVRLNRPRMIGLLLELGADPLAVDGSGYPAAIYAQSPDVDRGVMEAIRELTAAELVSAERGSRPPRTQPHDLIAALALGDRETAVRLARENPPLLNGQTGALHLMAKRNDVAAVRWLLDHGADADALWAHWDADVTALHLAILAGHPEAVRCLLDAGAGTNIRDSRHDGDARDWAEFFLEVSGSDEAPARRQILDMLTTNRETRTF